MVHLPGEACLIGLAEALTSQQITLKRIMVGNRQGKLQNLLFAETLVNSGREFPSWLN